MPITFKVKADEKLIDCTASGVLTDEQLHGWWTSAHAHPKYDPGFDLLVDLSRVDDLRLSAGAVRRLVDRERAIEPSFPGAKVAIVAAADAVYGISRMYQILMDESVDETRVFRSKAEALSWLQTPA